MAHLVNNNSGTFGCISVILGIIGITFLFITNSLRIRADENLGYIVWLIVIVIGFIMGIIGSKSRTNILAIIGMILCVLGAVLWLIFFVASKSQL